MQLLGFLRSVQLTPGDPGSAKQLAVLVDWRRVDTHMAKVRKSSRIQLDPDCLRWIPLLTQLPNSYASLEEAGGDTSSELATPGTEQSQQQMQTTPTKAVAGMAEKIQRVKIRKKIRGTGRRMGGGHRRAMPMKPIKRPPAAVAAASLQRAKMIKERKEVRRVACWIFFSLDFSSVCTR